jgi:holo-[acyl-carrier protein] synthase
VIVGSGIDVVEVERIAGSIERFGDRFLGHVYTAEEIGYCREKRRGAAQSFAARFAAKEAGAKALGTGIAAGVGWKEIEVRRRPGCAPTLHLSGRAAHFAAALGVRHIALSLSHTGTLAVAQVVMES